MFFGLDSRVKSKHGICQSMQACDSVSILWESECITVWFVSSANACRHVILFPFFGSADAWACDLSYVTRFKGNSISYHLHTQNAVQVRQYLCDERRFFISSMMTTTMNLKRKNESRRIKWSREGERTEEEETNEKRKWKNRLLS